ncbi:thioredoxin-like domain-containing protein [Pedobacter sp. Du54]|uniref:thioredoxin-like domain-containing protein n=1 Tax=Pedobacter anseongensis TaxID=3133439 RepID=UPI00309FDCAA
MKKTITTAIICLLVGSCLAQGNFSIKGNLPPLFNNYTISLLIKDDIGRYTEQTLTKNISNGKFSFEGNLDHPTKNAVLEVHKGNEKKYSLQFALDTGINELSIIERNPTYRLLSLNGKMSLSNIIKGKLDSLRTSASRAYREKNKIGQGAVALPFQETHQLDLDMLHTIERYPENYYALTRLVQLSKNISMLNYGDLIINALNTFSKNLQESELGVKMTEDYIRYTEANRASRVGQKMFDFEIKNVPDGKVLTNKDLVNKPYILAFSATWCVPCHEQLPKLMALYEKYKDQGLQVVYYNQDENYNEWVDDVKKNNLKWISVSEKRSLNSVSMRLGVHYIPTYFIFDKQGQIIYNSDQMDASLKLLEDYIKKAL